MVFCIIVNFDDLISDWSVRGQPDEDFKVYWLVSSVFVNHCQTKSQQCCIQWNWTEEACHLLNLIKPNYFLFIFSFRYCWRDFGKWRCWQTFIKINSILFHLCPGAGVFQSNEDLEVFVVLTKSHPMEPNGRRRRSRLASIKFNIFL